MNELEARQVTINDEFWQPRLEMNAQTAILYQWDQLEESHCIDNFRVIAEGREGFREGWFFADSDAFKWLDAASRAYATHPSQALKTRIDTLIALIGAIQTADGYVYTYNQFHFPGERWANLQIEHELYCHGHLIEAGVSHYQASGERTLLDIACKAADLLVETFMHTGPEGTGGHEEVELALIKLYRVTGEARYLALAEHFVEQRGRLRPFAASILSENRRVDRRSAQVEERRARYLTEHPEHGAFRLPAGNVSQKSRWGRLRFSLNALSGKYFQQHRPVREQTTPVGHAVRLTYLETAVAMLYRERGDARLLRALEKTWDHMVCRRMYITGGIGALASNEGFGRDYELDVEMAYAETCAALGCMFWNWEMALITRQAKYTDLFEWQLYNAAAVGIALDGRSYLYNNSLACRGELTRAGWYEVPCCPSNVARTWAALGAYVYSHEADALWVRQYIGSETQVELGGVSVRLRLASGLPWDGDVRVQVWPESPVYFTLHLQIPSWVDGYRLKINGQAYEPPVRPATDGVPEQTASGYSPYQAYYIPLARRWSPGDVVELDLPVSITVRQPHPQRKDLRGKVALTRGPLVYCLESIDNPDLDILQTRIDCVTLEATFSWDHFGGTWVLQGKTAHGTPFSAIPYYAWANRGPSQMTVWMRA